MLAAAGGGGRLVEVKKIVTRKVIKEAEIWQQFNDLGD